MAAKRSTAVWWAVGGLAVVGLFVYLRGRSSSTASSQVPTSIAPALTDTSAGPAPDSSSSDTSPSGGSTSDPTSSDPAYQPSGGSLSMPGGFGYSGPSSYTYSVPGAQGGTAVVQSSTPQGTPVGGGAIAGIPGSGGINPGGAFRPAP